MSYCPPPQKPFLYWMFLMVVLLVCFAFYAQQTENEIKEQERTQLGEQP